MCTWGTHCRISDKDGHGVLTAKSLTRMESGFDKACSLALHITSMPALDSTSHTNAGYVSVGRMAVCKCTAMICWQQRQSASTT